MFSSKSFLLFLALLLFIFSGCGGSDNPPPKESNIGLWSWMSGSQIGWQKGVYGLQGVPNENNIPGSRHYFVSWVDQDDNLWLFGGYGIDSTGTDGLLNDLWRWDGSNWTWISGSNTVGQSGVYGNKNTPHSDNVPGAREGHVAWFDSNGHMWLFGGNGIDRSGATGMLNDLWHWDGSAWTWVSGSDTFKQTGTYGILGSASASNMPGARWFAAQAIDSNDHLWLFGGGGYGSIASPSIALLNDLWRWDGANWTWMSGSDDVDQLGAHTGVLSPGGRGACNAWIDNNDNFWVFGGAGFNDNGANSPGTLNDLWRWDGSQWFLESGSGDYLEEPGLYGTQGVPAINNSPGSRSDALILTSRDNSDVWLFGGSGYDSSSNAGTLNDLWRWDGKQWTWESGSRYADPIPTFGTLGIANIDNTPPGLVSPGGGIDSNGNLLIIGGNNSSQGDMNALWHYLP